MNSNNAKSVVLGELNSWGWANEVLYRMCREEPLHTDVDVIAGEVWLIGRAYSAAIERGAGKHFEPDENFYFSRVAPMVKESGIDSWLASVRTIDRVTIDNVKEVLLVHQEVADLFRKIAGLGKESLASKYLHFHLPNAFFIFDSLADAKIKECSKRWKSDVSADAMFDTAYTKFVYRCLWYRDNVFDPALGRESTPRELDRYLLGY